MTTRREGTEDTFNELVALLRRNEDGEKHAADVEVDMRRLLMMARDSYLRDQLVQVQGVRRITQIAKAATNTVTQRICAGILGNLARSERGRLSASSCDSRWAMLSEEDIATITAESGKLDTHFFCDVCVVKTPLCYWDFLAAHAQHEQLLTENMFKSVGITRVPSTPAMVPPVSKRSMSRSAETEAHLHQHQEESTANKSVADFDEEDRSPWPSVMLFDRNAKLVGVGDKCFQIPASSRDPEVYILKVRYVSTRAYATTRQERAIPKKENGDNNTEAPISNKWEVSFAHQGALDIPLVPGNAIFWPARFTRDILALEYTRSTVDELEHAFLYEFQGEQPHDKTFSIGCGLLDTANPFSSAASPLSSAQGLWMNLTPRKGICMKLLAAQLGNLKKIQDVHILHTKKGKSGVRKLRKPHFPGQQLNKIAVDTT
ncbi:hypothetical protein PR002_g23533 [Phytophthora rubi]|uniref:Uncharacterized protein n=2 Tax=Phytophthora rubi TaxID=129364 RepID=A0A6A3IH04_9STRA|nr:hypothetical protein PR002_g23533 [Phytophthora rubi]